MNRLKPILGIVGTVARYVVMTSIFGMNALMGYIMFAPDTLPKPFYITSVMSPEALALVEGVLPPEETEAAPEGEAVAEVEAVNPLEAYHPGEGIMIDTGTKIVNLADAGGRRYLKTTITLEVAPPAEVALALEAAAATETSGEHGGGEAAAEDPALTAFNDTMSERMPIINDTLTSLLSSKTFETVYTVDGKEALRGEIINTLNQRVPDLYVIAVYFTEFIVQ
jgi:flagellar FliL protein